MNRYAWKYLVFRPARSLLIVASVGLCTVLISFLISVYRGVADGTLDYIRDSPADLWVLQENATNIVRGSSLLLPKQGALLGRIDGIASASPVLLTLSVVKSNGIEGTVYLVGYDESAPLGGPRRIIQGSQVQGDNEIVLDDRFAQKYRLQIGDTVTINQVPLTVCGLSSGTNAFVIQYAFVTLPTAQRLLGQVKLVSAYLVRISEPTRLAEISQKITLVLPGVSVLTHQQFLANNRREMQSGFLPFIVSVCVMSVGVLMIILSLLLSIMVTERRNDFAVMKTIGSPRFFLASLVLNLSFLIALAGVGAGLTLFVPVTKLVRLLAPELCTRTTLPELAIIAGSVIAACLMSALAPLRKLQTVYPGEVFV